MSKLLVRSILLATAFGISAAPCHGQAVAAYGEYADFYGIRRYGAVAYIDIPTPVAVDIRCEANQPGSPDIRSVTLSVDGWRRTFQIQNLSAQDRCNSKSVRVPLPVDPNQTFNVLIMVQDDPAQPARPLDEFTVKPKKGDGVGDIPKPPEVWKSDFDVLYGEDGKLGAALDIDIDFTRATVAWPLLDRFSRANVKFEAETSGSDTDLNFKDSLSLKTDFSYLFGKIGQYREWIVRPISLEADDELRNVSYKGSIDFVFEVPGSKEVGAKVQDWFGCDQIVSNCTSNGLLLWVGASANVKAKRNDGVVDRSDDFMGTAGANWVLPLDKDLSFSLKYDWQSQSPDGSSSESSEVGVTYRLPSPCQSGTAVTFSWINGEFMPGEQRRDAVRLGLRKLLGSRPGTC